MPFLDWQDAAVMAAGFAFAAAAWRYRQFGWAALAAVAALCGGTALSLLFPAAGSRVWLLNAYLLHFYLFLGSLYFFWNNVERLPDSKRHWRLRRGGTFLGYWALASAVQYAAVCLMLVMVWWLYPQPSWILLLVRLLQMVWWSPLMWYVLTAVLITVFLLGSRIDGYRGAVFSLRSLGGGLLLALMCQFAELSGIARGLWRLFNYFITK